MTLYITSFDSTVGPNSYIGSDRMLQTIADLWELPRNNAEKVKVILCLYHQHGNIRWAKLLCISQFSRVPLKFSCEYKHISLIVLNSKHFWLKHRESITAKTSMELKP